MTRYLSVCSGIEAATVAWHPLGWVPVGFSEIDTFPSTLLAHHYPRVPNLGDMTKYRNWPINDLDVLVGGTPCQSFSVAGLRRGLADPRGNLCLVYLGIADAFRPRWLVWENVPGVLSSDGGRDFGAFLGALVELGYGFSYRVLDAQFFGVPQRRRRVFVVAHLGDWRPAAAVLFERESLRRDLAPSRESREDTAPTLAARTRGGGGLGTDFDLDGGLIASNAEGATGHPFLTVSNLAKTVNNQTPLIAFDPTQITDPRNRSRCEPGAPSPTLAKGARPPHIAYAQEVADPITAHEHKTWTHEGKNNFRTRNVTASASQVRRLTPVECERLVGSPGTELEFAL